MRQALCSENAMMAMSYATVIATLPAIRFHCATSDVLMLLYVGEANELINEQASRAFES